MKICKINIIGFNQFQNIELDFTNPETGECVDKICFIGRNGTGKSTLLHLIKSVYDMISQGRRIDYTFFPVDHLINFEFKNDNDFYYYIFSNAQFFLYRFKVNENSFLRKSINKINSKTDIYNFLEDLKKRFKQNADELRDIIKSNSIFIYSPPESKQNSYLVTSDVP